MYRNEWSWERGSNEERGQMVRQHTNSGLSDDQLCDLFNLTKEGLNIIRNGGRWRVEFNRN